MPRPCAEASTDDDPVTSIEFLAPLIWNYCNSVIRRRAEEGENTQEARDKALETLELVKDKLLEGIAEELFRKRTRAPAH